MFQISSVDDTGEDFVAVISLIMLQNRMDDLRLYVFFQQYDNMTI